MDYDKHRTAKELRIPEITKYLEQNGFCNISLIQQWRHVTGSVEKNGIQQFFKMASSEGIAERTTNEFHWNNLINNDLNLLLPISVPKNYESGNYNGLFWFTCEFIKGKLLANPENPNDTQVLEAYIPKIAETLQLLLNLETTIKLPNDKGKDKTRVESKKAFLALLQHWMSQFETDVTGLYSFIENNLDAAQQAPSHGDFVPWHIFITNSNKLYLIDAEHSKINGFKFYDVAYLYHRLYTKLKRPDVADLFLHEFNNKYNFNEKDKECFKLILAQRVIGGYMDARNDGITDHKFQDNLRDRILQDDLEITVI